MRAEVINQNQLRRSGKSTRLIDWYVQQLFAIGKIVVKDHVADVEKIDDVEYKPIHQNLHSKVMHRLQSEHPQVKYKECDRDTLVIEIDLLPPFIVEHDA